MPLPSGVNLCLFRVFSSQNQQKLVQDGGTDKGATSLQHGLRKQLQPGRAAGVGGSNLLQDLDPSPMGRDKGAPDRAGGLVGILTWDWDNGDSVPLAWEHLGGRPRPQKTTSFHEGPAS